jgi:hypothetical protein
MSSDEPHVQHTQHAFLVAWGWFAEHIGLIEQVQVVRLNQKRGVSRTQSKLSWDEARQIAAVLERLNQPYIEQELALLRRQGRRICLDGDLTGLPVSNTSWTYPNAAYGHMDDDIRLSHQAGVVSLGSPTHGRLWLSIAHHPGDTVSCTQAEALVLAAEHRLAQHPRRRTALLRQRIAAFEQQMAPMQDRLEA